MSYEEFKQLFGKFREKDYFYLCIDRSLKQIKEDIVFVMKAKTHIQNALLKLYLFN